jgi:hypothetical protein
LINRLRSYIQTLAVSAASAEKNDQNQNCDRNKLQRNGDFDPNRHGTSKGWEQGLLQSILDDPASVGSA